MTIAKYTGWVQGRNHAPTPIEITGIALPYDVIRNVRVSCYFPALTPHEVAFYFDELPKEDFAIGQQVQVTFEHAPTAQTLGVVEAAEQARKEVADAAVVIPPPPPTPVDIPAVAVISPPDPTDAVEGAGV
jgi:hypothetical protein